MNLVNYLVDIYGYGNPIFIKDVRIGRKSKTAIREEFYRACKKGDIVRNGPGVYSIVDQNKRFPKVATFEKIIEEKYIYKKNVMPELKELFICGYYSGLTYINNIGISPQVPMMLEITTNRTSSKKRYFVIGKRIAIIRKARTDVTPFNYKILQFLDMFHYVTLDEIIDNRDLLKKYIIENQLSKYDFKKYISLYSLQTLKKITEGGLLDAFI